MAKIKRKILLAYIILLLWCNVMERIIKNDTTEHQMEYNVIIVIVTRDFYSAHKSEVAGTILCSGA